MSALRDVRPPFPMRYEARRVVLAYIDAVEIMHLKP